MVLGVDSDLATSVWHIVVGTVFSNQGVRLNWARVIQFKDGRGAGNELLADALVEIQVDCLIRRHWALADC